MTATPSAPAYCPPEFRPKAPEGEPCARDVTALSPFEVQQLKEHIVARVFAALEADGTVDRIVGETLRSRKVRRRHPLLGFGDEAMLQRKVKRALRAAN